MTGKRYVTVQIPVSLRDNILGFIDNRKLGYRNVSEFVIEAARVRLIELKGGRNIDGQKNSQQ